MLDKYAPHEFYADALSYRLMFAKRRFERIWFFISAAIFIVVLGALFWRREETNSYLTQLESAFVTLMFTEPNGRAIFLGLVGLLFLMNIGPTAVYYIRKYWIYPKSSMNLQAYLSVHHKETVKLPRGRNSKTPRLHYVHVVHPISGKILPVEVTEDWYMHLEAGNKVHAHYHPSSDHVLYLTKS